jgi:hypothetical protein
MAPRVSERYEWIINKPSLAHLEHLVRTDPHPPHEYIEIITIIVLHRNFLLLSMGLMSLKFPGYVSGSHRKCFLLAMIVTVTSLIVCYLQETRRRNPRREARKFINDYWSVFRTVQVIRTILQKQISRGAIRFS